MPSIALDFARDDLASKELIKVAVNFLFQVNF